MFRNDLKKGRIPAGKKAITDCWPSQVPMEQGDGAGVAVLAQERPTKAYLALAGERNTPCLNLE